MQFVAPKVTKEKFDHEVRLFNQALDTHRKRGILPIKIEYPNVYLAFSITKLRPAPIAFAVRINFDNYDLEPLSVVFVNPFSLDPISVATDIGVPFARQIVNSQQVMRLLQQDENNLPFLCIPGIREYHNHPSHSGDSWLLHRGVGGEGSLGFIIEKLFEYGITPMVTYQAQFTLNITGLNLAIDPNNIPL